MPRFIGARRAALLFVVAFGLLAGFSGQASAGTARPIGVVAHSVRPAATTNSVRPAEVRENVKFYNGNSNKCLEILDYRTDNFAPADQYSCYPGLNQLWSFSTDTGLIQNVNSKKCLEDLNYSTANGAQIGQYDCYGGANQRWWISPLTGLIENQFSHRCLEVAASSTAEFAQVRQWSCNGTATQIWHWGQG